MGACTKQGFAKIKGAVSKVRLCSVSDSLPALYSLGLSTTVPVPGSLTLPRKACRSLAGRTQMYGTIQRRRQLSSQCISELYCIYYIFSTCLLAVHLWIDDPYLLKFSHNIFIISANVALSSRWGTRADVLLYNATRQLLR